jgi:hypothetical protein
LASRHFVEIGHAKGMSEERSPSVKATITVDVAQQRFREKLINQS